MDRCSRWHSTGWNIANTVQKSSSVQPKFRNWFNELNWLRNKNLMSIRFLRSRRTIDLSGLGSAAKLVIRCRLGHPRHPCLQTHPMAHFVLFLPTIQKISAPIGISKRQVIIRVVRSMIPIWLSPRTTHLSQAHTS